jgi:branched-chain amino acid transport system substrate-binding protein
MAAQDYVNAHGGVHGRPVDVILCNDSQTAAGNTNCAEHFKQDGVVATTGEDAFVPVALPILKAAGIPNFTVGFSQQELSVSNSFPLDGANGIQFPGMAYYLGAVKHVKSVSVVVCNVVPACTYAVGLFTKRAKQEGVKTVNVNEVPVTTTDYSAAVAQAISTHPGAVYIVDNGAACTSAGAALKTDGYKGIVAMGRECIPPPNQLTSAFQGVLFADPLISFTQQSNPQVKTFLTAMAKYQPGQALRNESQQGFMEIMTLQTLMNRLPASSVAAANLLRYVQKKSNLNGLPIFMSNAMDPSAAPSIVPHAYQPFVRIYQIQDKSTVDISKKWIPAW